MIVSGIVTPVCLSHDQDLLAEYARILKPSGLLIIREPTVEQGLCVSVMSHHDGRKLSKFSMILHGLAILVTVLLGYIVTGTCVGLKSSKKLLSTLKLSGLVNVTMVRTLL